MWLSVYVVELINWQGMAEEVKTSMQFINDVVTGKLTAAKKENDFIYHAKIPTLESLPDIKG